MTELTWPRPFSALLCECPISEQLQRPKRMRRGRKIGKKEEQWKDRREEAEKKDQLPSFLGPLYH